MKYEKCKHQITKKFHRKGIVEFKLIQGKKKAVILRIECWCGCKSPEPSKHSRDKVMPKPSKNYKRGRK